MNTENMVKPIKEYNPEQAKSITNGMIKPSFVINCMIGPPYSNVKVMGIFNIFNIVSADLEP